MVQIIRIVRLFIIEDAMPPLISNRGVENPVYLFVSMYGNECSCVNYKWFVGIILIDRH